MLQERLVWRCTRPQTPGAAGLLLGAAPCPLATIMSFFTTLRPCGRAALAGADAWVCIRRARPVPSPCHACRAHFAGILLSTVHNKYLRHFHLGLMKGS